MINVTNLTFSYRGTPKPALHDLSFAIEPGQIFGFLGPSGAGKSTTQHILTGLLDGYGGTVTVFGKAPKAWGAAYYERIGVAFELPTHFRKLTAIENLNYFGALYRRPTLIPLEALALVDLADAATLRVEQFSKGMQNRLSVARALLHQPELLFLDEPTSGLDPVNARRIKELIRSQRDAGTTIFLTTHNMAVAEELCDQVAFIVDGRIELIDSPRALKLRFGEPAVVVEYRAGDSIASASFPLCNLGENSAFLNLLQSRPIETIHSREATLDDIFVRVTGRKLA